MGDTGTTRELYGSNTAQSSITRGFTLPNLPISLELPRGYRSNYPVLPLCCSSSIPCCFCIGRPMLLTWGNKGAVPMLLTHCSRVAPVLPHVEFPRPPGGCRYIKDSPCCAIHYRVCLDTRIIMPPRSRKQGSKKGKGNAAHQPDLPKRRKRKVSHSSDEAASPQQQDHQQEPHSGSEAEAGAGQHGSPHGSVLVRYIYILFRCFSFVSFHLFHLRLLTLLFFSLNLCLYISTR